MPPCELCRAERKIEFQVRPPFFERSIQAKRTHFSRTLWYRSSPRCCLRSKTMRSSLILSSFTLAPTTARSRLDQGARRVGKQRSRSSKTLLPLESSLADSRRNLSLCTRHIILSTERNFVGLAERGHALRAATARACHSGSSVPILGSAQRTGSVSSRSQDLDETVGTASSPSFSVSAQQRRWPGRVLVCTPRPC